MAKDIATLIANVQREMESRPQKLQEHCRRVAEEAVALAAYYDVDPQRVELASWSHDLFRHLPPEEQVRQARDFRVPVSEDDLASPIVLHGPIAAWLMREKLGITDDEVVEAVASHTLGLPEMTMVGKILLLADKFEPRKRDRRPWLKPIRILARRDLDLSLLCWSDHNWVEARGEGWPVHGGSWVARSRWVAEHHAELRMPGRVADDVFELKL